MSLLTASCTVSGRIVIWRLLVLSHLVEVLWWLWYPSASSWGSPLVHWW